jgi:hypothetical protein
MNHEQSMFLEILIDLARRQSSQLRDPNLPGATQSLYRNLANKYAPCKETYLSSLLRGRVAEMDLVAKGEFLHLETSKDTNWVVPVLGFKYRFADDESHLSLRLGLFASDEGAIGFRFEEPEGQGSHNFFHTQLIRAFGKNTFALPTPSWIPTSQPSFPLDAGGPISLLLNLLVSIYGMQSEVVARVTKAFQVARHIEMMHCRAELEAASKGMGVRTEAASGTG